MRIVIDMQGAQTGSRFRGIGRYTMAFTEAVVRNRGKHEIILVLSGLFPETIEPIRAAFDGLLEQKNILIWYAPELMADLPCDDVQRDRAELVREAFLANLRPDVIHICSLFEGFYDDAITSIGRFDQVTPVSVILHDLIPLLNPEHFLKHSQIFEQCYMRKVEYLKKAVLHLANSNYSRQEGIDTLGTPEDKTITISASVDSRFQLQNISDEAANEIRARFGITKFFVLNTGGLDEHKNLFRLMEAYAALPSNILENHQLVFVGLMNESRIVKFKDHAHSLGLKDDDFLFTGYITDEELVLLYNLCQLYVIPSWHEGFGFPALEAMACGAPVIGSNITSLPEVIGLQEALFDPFDVKSITTKLSQVLENETFRNSLREHGLQQAKKFSWDATAQRAITAWESLPCRIQNDYLDRTLSYNRLLSVLAKTLERAGKLELMATSHCIAQNERAGIENQLLLDVSELCQQDAATGVQRVVQSYLKNLLMSPPVGFRVEPVFATREYGYRYARRFTLRFLGLDESKVEDTPVNWQRGDVFLGLDMQPHVQLSHADFFRQLISDGVVTKFMVHDLLPIQFPEQFKDSNAKELYEQWLTMIAGTDGAICVSKATADSLGDWIDENEIHKSLTFCTRWVHFGADIESSIPSRGLTEDAQQPRSKGMPWSTWEQSTGKLKDALFKENFPRHQLLVDISELAQHDLGTGIQRVVRNILKEWLQKPPEGYRVEPIYATVKQGYRYAKNFKARFLGEPESNYLDEPIEYAPGDVFFGLDLQPQVQVEQRAFFQLLRREGVTVQFLVHDLLFLKMPQFFPHGNSEVLINWLQIVAESDGAVCVSKTTAKYLSEWVEKNGPARRRPFIISWSYSGADLDHLQSTHGIPKDADSTLVQFQLMPTFLMVGTLEPRKGHAQVLDSFEQLWQSGADVNLVIVGKKGWKVEQLVKRISGHQEQGKRLFWLEGIIDEYLEKVYAVSTCLIAASYGEGFGLPLIEAAQHKLPILARDIPVFREVAGEHAYFFEANSPEELSNSIKSWLSLYERDAHPKSDDMAWLTWKESAKRLSDIITSLPEVIGLQEAPFDPFDVKSITTKLSQVLENETFRNSLREHGLQQAIEDYQAIRKSDTMRPRLAYVSPLPPERSGIAYYSAELLPELAKYYEIEVIVEQNTVNDPWINANCLVHSPQWFAEHADQYDRVLYHFGNSTSHQHMFDLLMTIPGVVVLHDFFLSSIINYIEKFGFKLGMWIQELYSSHGYKALSDSFHTKNEWDVVMDYPCSLSVIQDSLGLIVHSPNSLRLAHQWYGDETDDWKIIPHMRNSCINTDRLEARKALGLDVDAFLVCSFGMLDPLKLNHRLINSWLESELARDASCHLVFIGNNPGDYGQELTTIIQKGKRKSTIHITGWAEKEVYQHYLAAADVAVQLRTLSRGETSGTVLDCMNYGLPTIVNANGSMGDFDEKVVWKLPNEFEDSELVEALETLWKSPESRCQFGERAREHILKYHSPDDCARQYTEAIENFYSRAENGLPRLIQSLVNKSNYKLSEIEVMQLAEALALNHPSQLRAKRLYLDVTATCGNDLKTGVERVVRALTLALIASPPEGFRVEPIYLKEENGKWIYRHAQHFTLELLDCPIEGLEDDIAEPVAGDVILVLDLSGDMMIQAVESGLHNDLRCRGVIIYFMIHDSLPVQMPKLFPPGADKLHEKWMNAVSQSDGAIFVSKTVADDFTRWLEKAGIQNKERRGFRIAWSHHGANIDRSVPTLGMSSGAVDMLALLKARLTFLMVGTIEPRKGYMQALAAFDHLWQEGIEVNLVIVAHEGWKSLPNKMRRDIPKTIEQLRTHPQRDKSLFWLEGISDEYLKKVYDSSTCLIAASFGEGFGLPLIEAAQHKLPILARDIPVFREVAGEHAYFFEANSPEELTNSIKSWLSLYERDAHPKSDDMAWLTWKESAKRLSEIIATTDHFKEIK